MPEMKTCVCCGYTSDKYREFKRAELEAKSRGYEGEWICRSYWKCVERGRPKFS